MEKKMYYVKATFEKESIIEVMACDEEEAYKEASNIVFINDNDAENIELKIVKPYYK